MEFITISIFGFFSKRRIIFFFHFLPIAGSYLISIFLLVNIGSGAPTQSPIFYQFSSKFPILPNRANSINFSQLFLLEPNLPKISSSSNYFLFWKKIQKRKYFPILPIFNYSIIGKDYHLRLKLTIRQFLPFFPFLLFFLCLWQFLTL